MTDISRTPFQHVRSALLSRDLAAARGDSDAGYGFSARRQHQPRPAGEAVWNNVDDRGPGRHPPARGRFR